MMAYLVRSATLDRTLTIIVWISTAIRLALVASFLVIAGLAGKAIASQTSEKTTDNPPIVCAGKNLLALMEKEDPEALARIERASAVVINGSSRFWRIEKAGLPPSWVFGTMHFADPRVVKIPASVESALDQAATVVVENTELLDQDAAAKTMIQFRSMMFLSDGSTLEKHYDENTIAKIKHRLKGRNVPYFLGKRMQPWVLATAIVMPLCEIERKQRKQNVLDYRLAQRAVSQGKKLVGLETIHEQLSAMAGLPFEFHLKSLKETVHLGSLLDDMMETMVIIYQQGKVGHIWPFIKQLTPGTSKGSGYAAFQQALITKRNAVMVERSLQHFAEGAVFMAVGALHLPGENGVLRQLQDAGYDVVPAF